MSLFICILLNFKFLRQNPWAQTKRGLVIKIFKHDVEAQEKKILYTYLHEHKECSISVSYYHKDFK